MGELSKHVVESLIRILLQRMEGIEDVTSIREALIGKRNAALARADFEMAVLLSHTIVHMSKLRDALELLAEYGYGTKEM